ncbi:predicted protein [Nematostella vectensis]|uniref:Uncharacterized protein n=1 Tax=Nematostella vectensis TaxID=45351 RepID=A7SFF8_NEMVE|nr:glutamate receptor ionotropic, NMDA 1 [Nematostella vectensis]XP_032233820.1 glutamate receptor ionotropic, NMDA 1 [Nematostella vectensis]XP_032233821.1 glutamate receptor ionotropic, NMDA 1 [Nematostella vectensis]XP_032233822.1 glutamate receptor ionotropic, NMDA 1 [Nematostella vectensis]EDO37551.1 predicted protein [Nematostella vectensis]|eukprot:XP_001629614.1 predicted protein [Nematostella vectensis]
MLLSRLGLNFLFCALVLYILTIDLGYARDGTIVKVGVVYDGSASGTETDSLYDWREMMSSLNSPEDKVDLQIIPISVQQVHIPQLFKVFCSRVINEDVAVLVLHTNDRLCRYIASLAAYFWIPVLGTSCQDPLLSDKDVYRSFVRVVPPSTQQFRVALELLQYTGNSEAFVIVGDEVTQGKAIEFFTEISSVDIKVVRVHNVRQPEINAILLKIKASITRAVFLYCDLATARVILWNARDFRMFKEDFMWIVSENVVRNADELFAFPSGIHGIRAKGTDTPDTYYRLRLEEGFAIIKRTFSLLNEVDVRRMSRSSASCLASGHWQYGRGLVSKIMKTQLKHSSEIIKFDDRGDRANFTYETVFLNEAVDFDKSWMTVSSWVDGKMTLAASEYLTPKGKGALGMPVLRAAVVEYPPLTMKSAYTPYIGCNQGIECVEYRGPGREHYTKYCCYGLAIDVLNYVKTELEFEPFVYFVRDGNYGAKNLTSGEWNGVVRDLIRGEADISIDLMTNEARSDVVDFSLRWTHAGLALLVLVGEKNVEPIDFAFFDPFTWQLWVGIIATVNVYLVALWIADRLSPYGYHQINKRSVDNKRHFELDGSMWYCWGVCFDNQFVEQRPAAYSSRAMSVCLAMFALLCLTSYTANLTAHLVSDDTKPYVTGIRDKKFTAKDSQISSGVVKSSYVDSYFELNQDPVMQMLFRRMRDNGHLVDNFTDGVRRVKSGELDIFISEILSLDYEVAKQKNTGYPRLQVVGASKPFADTGYSYSFRKNSTWKPKFDLVVNRLKAENKPSEQYKKWVSAGKKDAEEPHEQLTQHSLSGVFFLGASLAIVACLFLLVENKLWSMGLVYRSLRKCTETYNRGRRRFSNEIHRKLLEFNRRENRDSQVMPDISHYMEERRKTMVSLHSIYNPRAIKSKLNERLDSPTNTDSV